MRAVCDDKKAVDDDICLEGVRWDQTCTGGNRRAWCKYKRRNVTTGLSADSSDDCGCLFVVFVKSPKWGGSIHWSVRKKQMGRVSSNSRFQTVLLFRWNLTCTDKHMHQPVGTPDKIRTCIFGWLLLVDAAVLMVTGIGSIVMRKLSQSGSRVKMYDIRQHNFSENPRQQLRQLLVNIFTVQNKT